MESCSKDNTSSTIINKLFINLHDFYADYMYQTPLVAPRLIVRVGLLTFSTNIVTASTHLGFKIEVRDLALHLTNHSKPYDDNQTACGWLQAAIKGDYIYGCILYKIF